jgi:hypothetical protein
MCFWVTGEPHCLRASKDELISAGQIPGRHVQSLGGASASFQNAARPVDQWLSTTIAKHEWPLLALFTAPLKVTLECGR